MATLNVGKDFSEDPLGRYLTDSPTSGEAFREGVLKPALLRLGPQEKLLIILDDGVESYGSSFLTEGFAGLVKYGYFKNKELLDLLEFKFTDPDFRFYRDKIVEYISDAKYKSEEYIPKSR